jgi:starvation-inducible DNA-binding protein
MHASGQQRNEDDMAITTDSAHMPALGAHEREEVGTQLQATLVELIDLSLIGKQLHWSVTGSLFRPLHLYLDELIEIWRDLADAVAERAVAVGYWPNGQAAVVVNGTELKPVAQGPVDGHLLLQELIKRVSEVAERVRERMERLGELDAASQDVLVEAVRALEEQLWMIRAQLR